MTKGYVEMNKPYYRYFYLYRFFKTVDFRKQFLDGMLYCNTANWFHNSEIQEMGVADEFENADIISLADDSHLVQHNIIDCGNGIAKVYFNKYDKKPKNYKENQGFISYHREHFNIFCMSAIWLDKNGIVTEFDTRNTNNNFGNYGVFIMNVPKFIDTVYNSQSLNSTVKTCYCNPIQYISYENRDCVQSWNIWRKFDSYKSQQEFRIAFLNSDDSVLQYRLSNNLSGIIATIPNKQEFMNNIHVGKHIFSDINIKPIN